MNLADDCRASVDGVHRSSILVGETFLYGFERTLPDRSAGGEPPAHRSAPGRRPPTDDVAHGRHEFTPLEYRELP